MRFIIAFSFLFISTVCFAQPGQVNPECASCFTCTQLMSCFEDLVCADCDVTNELQSFSSPEGTIEIDQSDPLNIELDIDLECCEVLCTTNNPAGIRGVLNGLTTAEQLTAPINITSLQNANPCEMVAEVDFTFPSALMNMVDSRALLRTQYQILVNGAPVDGWRFATSHWYDRRGTTIGPRPQQQLGSAYNLIKIYVQPGDAITAQQRVGVILIDDNDDNFLDSATFSGGQSKITLTPRFIYSK